MSMQKRTLRHTLDHLPKCRVGDIRAGKGENLSCEPFLRRTVRSASYSPVMVNLILSNCLNNLISPFGSCGETLSEDMIWVTGQVLFDLKYCLKRTLSMCLFQRDQLLAVFEMLQHQSVIDIWLSLNCQCRRDPRNGKTGYPEYWKQTHNGRLAEITSRGTILQVYATVGKGYIYTRYIVRKMVDLRKGSAWNPLRVWSGWSCMASCIVTQAYCILQQKFSFLQMFIGASTLVLDAWPIFLQIYAPMSI